jgi:acetylornithine deacetylase
VPAGFFIVRGPEGPGGSVDVLALTRELVALETPTGSEGPATDLLAARLGTLGYRVIRQPVSPGRDNLYAFREAPVVVFSTHLDCVPPYVPLTEDETHLHGRGTCDAKGLAAAMVTAAERLAVRGERRVGLLFLVGEENGSDGAERARELGPKGRYVINGEPTENRLSMGQKGSLKVVLECTGRAAHSAYPAEGESAILPLLDTLDRLRRLPLPSDPMLGPSTLNIGVLQGGVAPNVIPPAARAEVLVRIVGPSGPYRELLATCAAPGVTMTFPTELPFFKNTVAAPAGWETTVVSYASDLPFLADWGQGFQLGPGTIRVAHTSQERIAKAELLEGVRLYEKLAWDLIASGDRNPV